MKEKIFFALFLIFGVATLIFLGLSLYWIHLMVWNSPWAVMNVIPFLVTSAILAVPTLVFLDICKPHKVMKIITCIALPGLILILPVLDFGIENLALDIHVGFSPEKWLRIEEKYRAEMAENFLSHYEVRGMEMGEIVSLLGEPDEEGDLEKPTEEYSYYYRYDCGDSALRDGPYHYMMDFYTADKEASIIIDYSFSPVLPPE